MVTIEELQERVGRLKAGFQQAIDIASDAVDRGQSCTTGDGFDTMVEALEQIACLGVAYDEDLLKTDANPTINSVRCVTR